MSTWSPLMQNTFEERIEKLKSLINNADNIVFFGGAGVSTESGIPDFRSKDGLYNTPNVGFEQYSPEYLLSHNCLYKNTEVFYEFYRQKLDVRNVQPNITHKKLAELEQHKNLTIITQNIDGLHQKAGSKNVLEIHGTTQRNYCTNCKKEFPADYIFNNTDSIPKCPCCHKGIIRPDVTLYEENLPNAFEEAIETVKKADLMIVAGTSLTVYPASTLTSYYEGKDLIIMNRDLTPQDKFASIIFRESLGAIFKNI